jgi:hypothetical protein
MTLIACVTPRKQPFFITDILASSKGNRNQELVLPTRAYLPPEKLRRMPFKPTGFARKIVEVNPKLMVAFAGNAAIALQFAERIRDWFLNCDVTNDFIIQFLTTYYSTKLPNFGAIIGAMLPDRFQSYWIGDTASGTSERWGNFVVAGSGMELFVDLVCEPRAFWRVHFDAHRWRLYAISAAVAVIMEADAVLAHFDQRPRLAVGRPDFALPVMVD